MNNPPTDTLKFSAGSIPLQEHSVSTPFVNGAILALRNLTLSGGLPHINLVNLSEKYALFAEHWKPRTVDALNDSYVKLAKIYGEYRWHQHEKEDRLFLVIKGRMLMRLREEEIWVEAGEFLVVPRGVDYAPVANEEAHVLTFQPKSTKDSSSGEDPWV